MREKGLGDEGEGFCTTPALYSFKLKLTPMRRALPLQSVAFFFQISITLSFYVYPQ
ncbi:hypothetical protein FDUTEX481_07840 [Tolypothrix sp. PCC 7601]|nr:hypothetical protein FDUTEX481_07840 [Tolypothrix sp. PCC 7601]